MADTTITNMFGDGSTRPGIGRVLELAQRHLELDVVCITEVVGDTVVFRAVAGDASALGIGVGTERPFARSITRLLLSGEIRGVVPDVSRHLRLASLLTPNGGRLGAFIGVPLRFSDGQVYGALSGLDRAPDPTLGERDVRFMAMLADLITADLDEQRRRESLSRDLGDLIETQSIDIALQPVVDLRSGRCLGVEALSRFPSGLGMPEQMFKSADEVGLRFDLERTAVSKAWATLLRVRADQFVAFNLSPDVVPGLARVANERDDLPLSQVVVEITEQAVIHCYDELRRLIAPLRTNGLRLAVDDAGAGYASLHHIVELRPDFIKVDRSLVHGIADDHARQVALSAFVLLGLDLNSTVIGEGVERPEDLATLKEMGVDAGQGFLLGSPSTDPAQLDRWVREEDLLGIAQRSQIGRSSVPEGAERSYH